MRNQRGSQNQPVSLRQAAPAGAPDADLLDARGAAALLGIKLQTLYAYVSRGLLSSLPGEGPDRRYARADVLRLRARAAARAGHGPVAAAALHFGEPVLESALTAVDAEGPRYRGHKVVPLARAGTPFESVAELLWGGVLGPAPPWRPGATVPGRQLSRLVPEGDGLAALALLVPALAAADPGRYAAPIEAELARARGLLLHLAAGLALPRDGGARFLPALRRGRVAPAAATALGAPQDPGASAEVEAALDAALVLVADHELNVSTFAARVAASAGADLYACVGAALSTLSGSRHGGACDRVEALVGEVARARGGAAVVHERLRRGESLPGFGHRLYPEGDPRTPPLLDAAEALGGRRPGVRHLRSLVAAVRDAEHPPLRRLGGARPGAARLAAGAAAAGALRRPAIVLLSLPDKLGVPIDRQGKPGAQGAATCGTPFWTIRRRSSWRICPPARTRTSGGRRPRRGSPRWARSFSSCRTCSGGRGRTRCWWCCRVETRRARTAPSRPWPAS
jgi:citrate synthase